MLLIADLRVLGIVMTVVLGVVIPLLVVFGIRHDRSKKIQPGDTVRLRSDWHRKSGDPYKGVDYSALSVDNGTVRIPGFNRGFGSSMFTKVKKTKKA